MQGSSCLWNESHYSSTSEIKCDICNKKITCSKQANNMAYPSWYMRHFSMSVTNRVIACVIFLGIFFIFMLYYFLYLRCVFDKTIARLSMTFTANGKRQKWNFCRPSPVLCTVESKYLYLLCIVRHTFPFLCYFFKDYKKRIENQR